MNTRLIPLILFILIICFINSCSAFQIDPNGPYANESWKNSLKKENFSKTLWTSKELHKRMPPHIKNILDNNGLVPWGFYSKRSGNNVLYTGKDIFSPILVTYIKDGYIVSSLDDCVYENPDGSIHILSILCVDIDITNMYSGKQAEAIFDSSTGKLVLFKIKINKHEWRTIYDEKNKIGVKLKI